MIQQLKNRIEELEKEIKELEQELKLNPNDEDNEVNQIILEKKQELKILKQWLQREQEIIKMIEEGISDVIEKEIIIQKIKGEK